MKSPIVTALALLICCAIVSLTVVFGYSRYKASQLESAAFRNQLQAAPQPEMGSHMPAQLPPGPLPVATPSAAAQQAPH